jgi:hypothetical protein
MGEGWKKFRRKGRMAVADGAEAPGTPRCPTVYDWFVPFLFCIQTDHTYQ